MSFIFQKRFPYAVSSKYRPSIKNYVVPNRTLQQIWRQQSKQTQFQKCEKIDYLNRPMLYLLSIAYDSLHYENTPMQYTAIFHGRKNDNFQMKIFDIFLNFCSKHRLWVLTSTHNLCFGAKIRKKCIPL